MAASHSLESKSAPAPVEAKHPAIVAFERFYESQSMIQVVKLFIEGKDQQAGINFSTRIGNMLPRERHILAEWADEQYGYYIESETEDSARLSPRLRTWLAIMHHVGIGIDVNLKKAEPLFQQAMHEGDGYACNSRQTTQAIFKKIEFTKRL